APPHEHRVKTVLSVQERRVARGERLHHHDAAREQAARVHAVHHPTGEAAQEVAFAELDDPLGQAGAGRALLGREQRLRQLLHKVTPSFQRVISRNPLTSLRVRVRPPATSSTSSNRRWPSSENSAAPVAMGPASKSIQPGFLFASAELVLILRVGLGKPMGVPLPVVNRTMCAPAATSAVEETPSLPGALTSAIPPSRAGAGSPYCSTSATGAWPPFCTQPSDFSARVVMPPDLLPGAGFSSMGSPWRRK